MLRSIPETPVCTVLSVADPVPYADALAWQYELVKQRQEGAIADTLLLLEHLPVITLGRGDTGGNLLTPEAELVMRGIGVERVDRGGEITYHAPGQMVGYPILDLIGHGRDLHRYLRNLEQVLIDTLAHFGMDGERVPGMTGVWVNKKKVAAIGIKVSKWVTMHGFALNVNCDLSPMRRDMVPCGLIGRDVTSLAELLPSQSIIRTDVEPVLVRAFSDVFGVRMRFGAPSAGITGT